MKIDRYATDVELVANGFTKTEYRRIETVKSTLSGDLIMVNPVLGLWAVLDESFDKNDNRVLRFACYVRDDKIVALYV